MEYNINEHEELLQMREQLVTLRSKLENQQIVSEKMILQAIRSGVSNINRRGLFFSVFGLLTIPFCCGVFYAMDYSDGFVLGTGAMLFVSLCATIYIHLGLRVVDISRGNMIEVGRRVLRLRKQYVYWHLISFPMILVWGYFLYREVSVIYPDPYMRNGFLIGALIGGVIGGTVGLVQHFKVVRAADEVLANISDLQE